MMKRSLILLVLSTCLLNACQPNASLSFSKTTGDRLAKEEQSFFTSVRKESGVHIYHNEQSNSVFVYLNDYAIDQGESAHRFNHFNVEAAGNELHLSFETDTTTDYPSEMENQLFYEVRLDKEYDTIRLFNNGDEIAFNTISGNLE